MNVMNALGFGDSVIMRIKAITKTQPRGGYLPFNDFKCIEYNDGIDLNVRENIHGSTIGLVVDYLSRYYYGDDFVSAFYVPLNGAKVADKFDELSLLSSMIIESDKLSDDAIIAACKLVGFDVMMRTDRLSHTSKYSTVADKNTIENIRTMVNRSLTFFENEGPIIKDGFTFEGAYTDIISSGDGDFLTNDTLWDMKVLRSKPNKDNTLQLLVYYLMGLRSVHDHFKNITKLGFFNPRENKSYIFDIKNISQDVIDKVNYDVIGYR